MIILLYGKDVFRKKEKLEKIIEGYKDKHKSGLNIKFIEEKTHFSSIYDENRQVSMFNEKKLIVVRDLFSSPEMKELISYNVESMESCENIIVFYEEKEIRKNDALLSKLIKSGSMVQEFNTLPRSGVLLFIRNEAKKINVEINEEALQLLVDFVGSDLWRAKGEIEKLSSYGKKITKKEVLLLVRPEVETNIFKTVDALAEGKKEIAASLIYEHLQKGDHPLYLLSMIEYQFRNLIMARDMIDNQIPQHLFAEKGGMHPFVARKSSFQARAFSREKLEKSYALLFKIDLKVKTGQLDPVIAIHIFLSEF